MILLLADIHGNVAALRALIKTVTPIISNITATFIAGDLPGTIDTLLLISHILEAKGLDRQKYAHYVYSSQRQRFIHFQNQCVKKCLEILEKSSLLTKPLYYIPGNVDTHESVLFLQRMSQKYPKFRLIQDEWILSDDGKYYIGGIGGSITYMAGSPCDREFKREVYENKVSLLLERLPSLNNTSISYILFTHEAPLIKPGTKNGSNKLNSLIKLLNPTLAISGHYHENQGILNKGKSLIINPGALTLYNFAVFSEKYKKVKFYRLKIPITDLVAQVYRFRKQFIK